MRIICNNKNTFLLTIYRTIFWIGYIAILVVTLIPIRGISLNKINLGPEAFQVRLDHLLHFTVYLLICIYYLTGWKKGLLLFTASSLTNFVLLVLFLAIVTELIQLWVPERAFNVFDLVANVAGVGAGLFVIKMVQRYDGSRVRRSDGAIV